MTAVLRSIFENTLEGMESGRFQDFCLEFLPIYGIRFKGLQRRGHTADGKTRKGVPDLLKIDENGKQIAVECGTEKNYWKPSKRKERWKPYKDALKTEKKLDYLIEIVLISNREQNLSQPNDQSQIMEILKDKISVAVTLVSLEDISQYIFTNLEEPLVEGLLRNYFPEVSAVVSPQVDARKYRIASEIASQKTIDAKIFFPLVSEAVELIASDQEAKKYLLEKIDGLNPNWRLKSLPPFEGVNRQSVDSLPLTIPFGKVWSLVGVPKIGKTFLLFQLKKTWGVDTITWYDCPANGDDCSTTIVLDLLKTLVPSENEQALLESNLLLDASLKNTEKCESLQVFVIDNANFLPLEGLKQIARVLLTIKRNDRLTKIGFIFTSNKNLLPLEIVLDEKVIAPPWTSDELSELLQLNHIPFVSEEGKYLDSLSWFSGGHPLFAISLAKKHSSTTQLLSNLLQPGPKTGDEDLSKEVQSLLYDDILCDADSQNLVQRLSILGDRVPRDILETLRTDIVPHIGSSSSVIIDRVGQSLIEGDDDNGYTVSFIFREIAKKKISPEEKQLVWQAVSKKFLTLTNRTMSADRVCEGIFCAFLASDFEAAYRWTSIIVWKVSQNDFNREQLSSLLSRLDFLFYFQEI